MFTCNDINLLTFTYYLKYFLAINIIIIPFIYFYINLIIILKKKLIINSWYLKKKTKSFFYIFIIFSFSLIIHNMLNNNNNVCYINATSSIYQEYKTSYYFLENKNINNNIKYEYLNNILTNKEHSNLDKLVYKEEIKEEISESEPIIEIKEDNFLHENDLNMQNSVYISDGVFYYPNYIYQNSNTYSGMYCPNNPLEEGFNNSYGYNNYFYTRLNLFIDEAAKNGYKITMSIQGCRNYDTQVYYYNTMESGRAISPGHSLHGFGIASDLEFYQSDGSICPYYRNDSNCPSMGWAHNNAYKYGLVFPLLNASYKEDWHIEPMYKNKY